MSVVRALAHGVRAVVVAGVVVVAVSAIAVFALARLGYVNPLVVISGSMEPGISRGDLLIDTRVAVSDLRVGQVVSIAPDADHVPVSHRIVEMSREGDQALLHLKGDANTTMDAPLYQASGTVWAPRWRIPLAGFVLEKLVRPAVMVPLALAVVGLIVLAMVPPAPKGRRGVRPGPLALALRRPGKGRAAA